MAIEEEPQDNISRLLKHLRSESLAARLVEAYGTPTPMESMRAILTKRVAEVKEENAARQA